MLGYNPRLGRHRVVGPDEGEGLRGGRSIDQLFAGNAQGIRKTIQHIGCSRISRSSFVTEDCAWRNTGNLRKGILRKMLALP